MKCDKTESIWLEDELNDKEKADLKEHIKSCGMCSREYKSKKAFDDTVDDFIKRGKQINLDSPLITRPKKKKRRAKFIPLVAAMLVILLMSGIAYSKGGIKGGIEYLKDFTTKNFGWSYGVIQDGKSFVQDNLVISVSPIAVSKSSIVFGITIDNLDDDTLIYSTDDIWVEADGKTYRPDGFVSASYNLGFGYGELGFNLTDGLPENILIKVKDFDVYKVKKNGVRKTNKVVKGVFEYPITIEKEIINKANNNALVYPLDKVIELPDLKADFNSLEVNGARAVINHDIEQDSFIVFGDVRILDINNSIISERKYDNGLRSYSDEKGKTSIAMMNENTPYETVLLPFTSSKPAKIEISSYIAKQSYAPIDLIDYIKKWTQGSKLNTNKPGQITLEDIALNVSIGSSINTIEISCESPKLLEFALYNSNQALEPVESTVIAGLNENGQPGETKYYNKYQIAGYDDLHLDIVETREFPIELQIQITK